MRPVSTNFFLAFFSLSIRAISLPSPAAAARSSAAKSHTAHAGAPEADTRSYT
jgi:hypothetical protein